MHILTGNLEGGGSRYPCCYPLGSTLPYHHRIKHCLHKSWEILELSQRPFHGLGKWSRICWRRLFGTFRTPLPCCQTGPDLIRDACKQLRKAQCHRQPCKSQIDTYHCDQGSEPNAGPVQDPHISPFAQRIISASEFCMQGDTVELRQAHGDSECGCGS